MQHPALYYGKFLALLGIVSAMVAFNFLRRGFHPARQQSVWQIPGARPERGPELIRTHGCVACHVMRGSTARPHVGPSLEHLPDQLYLAGTLPNTPENLVQWIQHPERIRPGTAMPDLGIGEQDAEDIAAYLLNSRKTSP
jgi:cytochrome c